VLGGYGLCRSALLARRMTAADEGDESFLAGKLRAARFYATSVLPNAEALARATMEGADTVLDFHEDAF
jgi:predicted deacylase